VVVHIPRQKGQHGKLVDLLKIKRKKELEEEENLPHVVFETICVKCYYRSIDVFPLTCDLKDLVCGGCGEAGHLISTGQHLLWEAREARGLPTSTPKK
jgi:hypothetical protein